jgi:hypothetical protein
MNKIEELIQQYCPNGVSLRNWWKFLRFCAELCQKIFKRKSGEISVYSSQTAIRAKGKFETYIMMVNPNLDN